MFVDAAVAPGADAVGALADAAAARVAEPAQARVRVGVQLDVVVVPGSHARQPREVRITAGEELEVVLAIRCPTQVQRSLQVAATGPRDETQRRGEAFDVPGPPSRPASATPPSATSADRRS